jgi:hypothetical protein
MTDEHADSGRVSNDGYQMAVRIAQRLREAGLKSQILNLMPADTTVLRRDRIVIILAFTLLTALAWSYLLWLASDMGMGGYPQRRDLLSSTPQERRDSRTRRRHSLIWVKERESHNSVIGTNRFLFDPQLTMLCLN